MGQPEKAITALKGALARNPNFLPARFHLAGVYSELDREAEAQTPEPRRRARPHYSVCHLGMITS